MARIAGCCRRRVVVIGVALRTSKRRVHSGQRIVGIHSVIEIDGCPVGRGVARFAGGRKSRGGVIRIRRAVPIGLMAAEAICRQRGVIVVRVALGASYRGMRPSQRKYRSVVERRGRPPGRRVAQRAVGRETRRNVIGIGCAVEVRLMASVAVSRQARIVVVYMALGTCHVDVRARERERGVVVIKGRRCPRRCVVAGGAGCWEPGGNVVRIIGGCEVALMASVTVGR